MSSLHAQDTEPPADAPQAPAAAAVTEESLLQEMTSQLSALVNALSDVRDEQTANEAASRIEAMVEKLYSVDFAELEGIDEEVVAAGLADLFNDLELQVSRLYEEDFYGNDVLRDAFGGEDDSELAPPPGKDDDEPGDEEDDSEPAPEE